MNILYLSADRGIPIRGTKGAAVHVRSLTAAFDRLGHPVTLLTPRPGPEPGQPVQARLVHVPLPDEAEGSEKQAQVYADMLAAAAINENRMTPFDLVYERYSLWSDAGAVFSRITQLPFVLEVNAPLVEEAAHYRALADLDAARAIERRQFEAADAVAVVSAPLAEYVVLAGANPERVHIVPNGVDPQHFHPAVRGGRVHHRYGLQKKKVIGFAGRARPWHDLETLLQAFTRLQAQDPDYHLLLVGEMPPDLPERLAELQISAAVTLTGPVPHSAVPEHIAAMQVAVSSHAAADGFYFSPLKLYEYMACGVPVVAADQGQPAELVEPGRTGELYSPGDPEDLARKIEQLVRQPALAREIAWNGAVRVLEKHTWEQNARRVCSWIQPATGNPGQQINRRHPELPILDPKLRQRLYRATRADLAGELLRRKGPKRRKSSRLSSIEILKYKPGRRGVLRYRWEKGNAESATLIGKVFRDGRGRRLDAVHRILSENGLGSGPVRVPRPFGYSRKMRMQLQEDAPGVTLNDLYRQGSIEGLVERCAEGAAKLHKLAEKLPASRIGELRGLVGNYFVSDEVQSLAETLAALCEMRPDERGRFSLMHAHLARWARDLPSADTAALVHRDFYYSQVLIHPDGLVLIDLDLLAFGDAAIDVANFAAHLNFLALETDGNFHALSPEAADFKAAYQAARPQGYGFWERVRFYEAATWFRLLRVVAQRPQKAPIFEPLLAETLASLEVV